jgi:cysteine desulfurase/selenocysteine lyase
MTSLRTADLDVHRIRAHFDLARSGRIVTNNAASTQPPRQLLDLYRSLIPSYENVHRGQSTASQVTTALFEESYDTIAGWLNAPTRRSIATYRNTTEAHNAVMYSLLTEFRDGDNIVVTMLEHNSNFVPWYGLCREILPRLGRTVDLRIARFDHVTGELDLNHLASLVDSRTKLICCTGASNFLGSKPDLGIIRDIADRSGYHQPNGECRSRLLVDGAQLVPTSHIDVQAMDVDYLSFSFHKFLAPFGVGVLYAKEHLLEQSLPFLSGGDMIGQGQVSADHVGYNDLPWKYSAGTPNILGVITSAQALRFAVDLIGAAGPRAYFRSNNPIPAPAVAATMTAIGAHTRRLTERAMESLAAVPGLTIYGPAAPRARSPLVAFNVAGRSPFDLAEALNDAGVESRAGCHCATLAHRDLGLDPAASCRLSFYLYNSTDDVDQAVAAVRRIVTGRRTGRHRARDNGVPTADRAATGAGTPRHRLLADLTPEPAAGAPAEQQSFALTRG